MGSYILYKPFNLLEPRFIHLYVKLLAFPFSDLKSMTTQFELHEYVIQNNKLKYMVYILQVILILYSYL